MNTKILIIIACLCPALAFAQGCDLATRSQSTTTSSLGQCADDYRATCLAALTQEALANPRPIGKDKNSKSVNIPGNARIITYYHDTEHLAQSRIDCETGGGLWKSK